MAPALSLLAGVPPRPSFLGDVTLTPLRSIPVVAPTLSPSLPRCRGQGWSPACPLPNASSTTGAVWGPYCAAEGLHRPSSPSPSPPGGAALSPPRCPRGWGARMRGRGRRRLRALMWGQLCAQRMKCPAPRAPQPSSLCPAPRRSPPDPQPLWGAPPQVPDMLQFSQLLPGGFCVLGHLGRGGKKKQNKRKKKSPTNQHSLLVFAFF